MLTAALLAAALLAGYATGRVRPVERARLRVELRVLTGRPSWLVLAAWCALSPVRAARTFLTPRRPDPGPYLVPAPQVADRWASAEPITGILTNLIPARDTTPDPSAPSAPSTDPGGEPTDGSEPMADRTPGRRRLPGTDLLVWPDPDRPEDRVVADHRGVPFGTAQALSGGWRDADDPERTVHRTLTAAAEAIALRADPGRRP